MKKLLLALTLFLSISKVNAQCHWSTFQSPIYTHLSCDSGIILFSSANSLGEAAQIGHEWFVNGRAVNHEPYRITNNGTHLISLRAYDHIRKCDTMLYDTVQVNCMPACQWSKLITEFSVVNTCRGWYVNQSFFTGLKGQLKINNALSNYYRYDWTINGNAFNGNNPLAEMSLSNGTYNVCVKITDTILNCDTTLCKTGYVSCPAFNPNSQWYDRFEGMTVNKRCDSVSRFVELSASIKYNFTTLKDYLSHQWYVNSVPIPGANMHYFAYHPLQNGTYDICLQMRDSVRHLDTMICRTVNFDCAPLCNWKSTGFILWGDQEYISSPGPYTAIYTYIAAHPYSLNYHKPYSSYKYTWTVNGNPSSGRIDLPYFHYIDATANGTYSICLTITDTVNNCDTTYCRQVQVNNNVGLEKISGTDLRVYPNPASKHIQFEWTGVNGEYVILDLTGKEIRKGNCKTGLNQIAVNDLKTGMYILHVISREQARTAKFLVE